MRPIAPDRRAVAQRAVDVLPGTGALVRCPDAACGQPAEIVDAWHWRSTDSMTGHVRTRCVARHCFTWPARLLTPAEVAI